MSEIKRGGAIGFHEIQPAPDGEHVCKCGWCHGSGYCGASDPICSGCKGVGWWILDLPPDKRIRKKREPAEVEPVPERPPVLASGNDGPLLL